MASPLPFLLLCLTTVSSAALQYGPCPDNKYKYAGATHTACLLPSPVARSWRMTLGRRRELLDAHNHFRRGVQPPAADMLAMTWDADLEMLATKWAEGCDEQRRHDPGEHRFVPQGFKTGQNGYWGIDGNLTEIVELWYSEVKDFEHGGDNDVLKVGHYTQVVWHNSYKLGCGAAMCGGMFTFFCNYGPTGNFDINLPYKAGARGADCLKNDGGLCDCGDIHCNSGNLDPKTCACVDCNEFTTSGPNCKWTGHKCEDHIGVETCELYAKYNGGKDRLCRLKWIKERCHKYCGLCCEDRIGDWPCENYIKQNSFNQICSNAWGKDHCYKSCGYC